MFFFFQTREVTHALYLLPLVSLGFRCGLCGCASNRMIPVATCVLGVQHGLHGKWCPSLGLCLVQFEPPTRQRNQGFPVFRCCVRVKLRILHQTMLTELFACLAIDRILPLVAFLDADHRIYLLHFVPQTHVDGFSMQAGSITFGIRIGTFCNVLQYITTTVNYSPQRTL